MPRITLIGAGSLTFAKNLIGDILSFEALSDSEIVLMDLDEDRLDEVGAVTEAMIESGDVEATVETTTDRREALTDTDYVFNLINVGGLEPFENEIRIPEEYGVKQAIGDTLGPGGIFRGLRTVPVMVDMAKEMEEVCPDAPLLNYTNPMVLVSWATHTATDIDIYGLCHSIPHTAQAIADYIDIPYDELDYWAAGINHMAWFLDIEHDGEDLYPALHKAMGDEDIYRQDTVRFEVMDHFGAFVSESSHHMSEYVPYFRTDEDRIEELVGEGYAGRMETAAYLEEWSARHREHGSGESSIDPSEATISRSDEYAARIIHSIETGKRRRLNLNVTNETNAIGNLQDDAFVEVPALVDGTGIHPMSVGDLPEQLAALNRTNLNVQRLAVEASLTGDRETLYRAMKLDPLTAASISLDEIESMTDDLLVANSEYLPQFEATGR